MSRLALRPSHLVCSLALAVFCVFHCSIVAADDSDVIQIEEHWELHVGGPDPARSAPQVTMIMSPADNLEGDYFAFTLNHHSYPDFAEGGYQLQRWHGEECLEADAGIRTSPIESDGEVITWVQRLTIDEGVVRFQVVDGEGDSWNHFGGESFDLTVATQFTKLNNYRPRISIEQSGIGYAGNRVSSLVLRKLRWKTADGEEHEMVAPIDIDADIDP